MPSFLFLACTNTPSDAEVSGVDSVPTGTGFNESAAGGSGASTWEDTAPQPCNPAQPYYDGQVVDGTCFVDGSIDEVLCGTNGCADIHEFAAQMSGYYVTGAYLCTDDPAAPYYAVVSVGYESLTQVWFFSGNAAEMTGYYYGVGSMYSEVCCTGVVTHDAFIGWPTTLSCSNREEVDLASFVVSDSGGSGGG